jgi:hypothetical protein
MIHFPRTWRPPDPDLLVIVGPRLEALPGVVVPTEEIVFHVSASLQGMELCADDSVSETY